MAPSGAPPSNRAPHNYIEGGKSCRVLRCAIDSLYLSYRGNLSDRMLERLESLKATAQSEDEPIQAAAQLIIGQQLFAVAGRGQGRFRFVLTDERFYLLVSAGQTLPLAYAQISSEYLTSVGVEAAVDDLRFVVNTLGRVDGNEQISRVDPCVDLMTNANAQAWDARQWITGEAGSRPYAQHGMATDAKRGRRTGSSYSRPAPYGRNAVAGG